MKIYEVGSLAHMTIRSHVEVTLHGRFGNPTLVMAFIDLYWEILSVASCILQTHVKAIVRPACHKPQQMDPENHLFEKAHHFVNL